MRLSSAAPAFAFLCVGLLAPTLIAQNAASSPAIVFSKARALYYTPVDAGLQSFHCDVSFDWKTFMQKATHQPVPDDDARLRYLRTIQLSVDDDLRSAGELHWVAPSPAPEGTEDSVGKMREGVQQMWSGFFQSWNSYATGNMVTLDATSNVERTPNGYHVRAHTNAGLAEEQYDDKLLLQTVHVSTPTLDSVVSPGFTASPQGMLVTSIRSTYKQPPGTEATEVLMRVSYAPVGTFQLPSELSLTVGAANFDFHLGNCTAKSAGAK